MDIESMAASTVGRLAVKVLGAVMESRFRYRFFGPTRILTGADVQPGLTVLEIGCGTGYFTLPLARLLGDRGHLVAIDILAESVALVSRKVEEAGLTNVQVMKADALDIGFDAETFDLVLLFGIIPAPMLPLRRLIPEVHRLLKADGGLAIWPSIPGWLPKSILRFGLFTLADKRNGVYSFKRC